MIDLMKIKPIYMIAILVIAGAGVVTAAQLGNAGQVETKDSMIIEFDEDSLQSMRQADALEVCNVIQNMQNGDVTAGEAREYIFDEKFYAKKVIDCTPEETKINNRYVDFLDAAKDTVNAYGSSSFQEKLDMMNDKKDLI